MGAQQHSTAREGTITGLIGAGLVALWFFIFDLAAGMPFRTPSALGTILFRGDIAPGGRGVMPGMVVGFTIVHVVLFILAGMGLTFLFHLAARNPVWRMGVWIGLVVAFALFAGLTFMLTTATGERLPLWSVLGGAFAGVAGMAGYLWRRHPRLQQSFHESPMGSEEPAPAHPPRG